MRPTAAPQAVTVPLGHTQPGDIYKARGSAFIDSNNTVAHTLFMGLGLRHHTRCRQYYKSCQSQYSKRSGKNIHTVSSSVMQPEHHLR